MTNKEYILVVDDYFPIRRLMHDVLLEEGYTIQLVSNGKECLERVFSESKPALILLDWQMPGLSGYEVLRELKNNCETKQIPIIMVTGEQGVEELVLEAGAYAIISKPFDFRKLLEAVRSALQG